MKVFIAQINPHVGNIEKNKEKIIESIKKAKKEKADIIVFPELCLTGYPTEDLVFYDDFIKKVEKAIKEILKFSRNILIILGSVRKSKKTKDLFNSAYLFLNEKIIAIKDKSLLPNYDMFNETRYFTPSKKSCFVTYKKQKIGILISEDAWQCSANIADVSYDFDPTEELK